jgi:hypothetical protein
VCLGSCFFGYTAKNSHHLTARIISKDPLFQEEKIPARKRGRCQVTWGKSSKTNFCVWRKAHQRATQATPYHTAPGFGGFTHGENAKLGYGAWNPPAGLRRGEKGRGEKYCVSLIT